MNLWIGKVKNYNNKILISSPSFKIGANLKINLNGEKDEPDVKSKKEEIVKTKPDIKSNKEHKQDVRVIRTNVSVNSNWVHPPGNPWGLAKKTCPGSWNLTFESCPGAENLTRAGILWKMKVKL